MKINTAIKLHEAIANAQNFIKQMEQMDDKKLSNHLDLFHQQMQKAYQQKNDAAYKLLHEYEQQTLVARLNKIFLLKSKAKYCESRINEIVYQLYELTEAEIKIVERNE